MGKMMHGVGRLSGLQLAAPRLWNKGILRSLGGGLLQGVFPGGAPALPYALAKWKREALQEVERVRGEGFAAAVEVLGEARSEEEAELYTTSCLKLIDGLEKEQAYWKTLSAARSDLDWGHAPKINLTVHARALAVPAGLEEREARVAAILKRLRRILQQVVAVGGFLCIELESCDDNGHVLEAFRRLKLEYRDYPHLGIGLRCRAAVDLEGLIRWARTEGMRLPVRLADGGEEVAFRTQAALLLRNHDICPFACASRHTTAIAAVVDLARMLAVPQERYEFQVPRDIPGQVLRRVRQMVGPLRLICPMHSPVPGRLHRLGFSRHPS